MQALEFIPPAPDSAPSSDRTRPGPAHPPRPGAEHFDTIMGRALARSSRKSSGDSDSSDEPSRRNDPSTPQKKTDPANAAHPDAQACAQTLPAPPAQPLSPARGDANAPGQAATPAGSTGEIASEADGQSTDVVSALTAASNNAASTAAGADSASGESGLAGELTADPGNGTAQPLTKIDLPSAAIASEQTTGISGAKHTVPMQKAENTNDVSGSTEQKLPAGADVPGEELPARAARLANFKLNHVKSDTDAPTSSLTAPGGPTETLAAGTAAAEWPSPVRSLERTHDLMALHAMRLRDSSQDSLQVVIKPDAGLQLSLNLQMRDGTVEMRALLHRGNFELLNLHWPELQQQLEARGIRLAPLASQDAAANGHGDLSQQSGRKPAEERTTAGAFAEFAPNSTLVPPAAAKMKIPVPRGWESWA